ncbi:MULTISPECIES: bifunctional precorrin-2 dehydrogenase/sirohydrochlorin ferrochelatase [Brevibacillus]|jgi:precorrin-2 dehydrogenase/sirohydrochlorin ferrochelatase|uniref:precorrin-2 dehydrogenase n=1 Tax=Brevibacillus parabrevis TaxID=54914 RepID=A0A4Y3PD20_BREPA|nr:MULTISPECIES: bifunctional precorrin-2 dehydrogenase/sirohydrochlorin ferrochelatase [Brevibacillus]NRQ52692.1 bifunctional precorrin-2 dehydrogenase/sirohydrochlorin ferrochelatase [Brevibacillus sp. HD1.4A]RNB96532.1 bifunctional precorrin-2 dehydrogenase/sirohydrochlorin ferrochelatase [Brevibacillus parabrevis]GEB30525.1 siroheme synthase [Brevibacillus parabrevis]
MPHYAMMVNLERKRCVVVGGGQVAERKIASLLAAGADVCVVSPTCTEAIHAWGQAGRLTLWQRPFASADVSSAVLVVAATSDSAVNLAVYEACQQAGCPWINVVDRPDLCSFTVPSVVERGDLTVAISTGGNNPGLAKKLRRQLEAWIGPEYKDYTRFLGTMRKRVLALDELDAAGKRAVLAELLDDRFLEWTRSGEIERRDREAEAVVAEWLGCDRS